MTSDSAPVGIPRFMHFRAGLPCAKLIPWKMVVAAWKECSTVWPTSTMRENHACPPATGANSACAPTIQLRLFPSVGRGLPSLRLGPDEPWSASRCTLPFGRLRLALMCSP